MTPNYKRNPILRLNRFQKSLLFPVIIASLLTSCVIIFTMLYLYYIGENIALFTSVEKRDLQLALPWFMDVQRYNFIIPVLAGMLVLMVCWAYHIIHRFIGPHERVIRELDEVLAGIRKEPIVPREGDDLFEELLRRINALIKKIF